ncbi:MAG: EAL domain-containing protein [Sulfurimonas sp.]|nr:EAL domain-containing protein [Sulfurimonas sp.]MDD5203226.1 EAL domain-containing protein [Sulfurimonas sp.]
MIRHLFSKKLSLSAKLSLIIVSLMFFIFALIGFYFDSFLKENYLQETKKRVLHGFERIALNIKTKEKELITGISFAQTDELLKASLDLINKYEEKNNYNHLLLDEEKKSIAKNLLDKVKHSFNDDIALYGANEELIAYVTKEDTHYTMHFISYENAQRVLYSKDENDTEFVQRAYIEENTIAFRHAAFYKNNEMLQEDTVSHHFLKNSLIIKGHNNIYEENKTKVAGHIEMASRLDAAYFATLSENLNMQITINNDVNNTSDATPLMYPEGVKQLFVKKTDTHYRAVMSMQTRQGEIYFVAMLEQSLLQTKFEENRKKFFIILLFLMVAMLLALRTIVKKALQKPLELLMKQIEKIAQRDYTPSKVLYSGDELEVISKSVNTLATTVSKRESELKASEENLFYLSNHDTLTGLPNRRFFTQRLEHAIKIARRNSSKAAVLMLDLDEFKEINDSMGHDVGDKLLQSVTQRVLENLRSVDTFARIGGDEFYILIEQISNIKDIQSVIEKILEGFRDSFHVDDTELKVTASIGIAIYPENGEDALSLIKNVDLAMYKSKSKGKNSFSFFSQNLSQELHERMEWIAALKQSVKTFDEFFLEFQPKVSCLSKKTVSVEALVRWRSEKFGLLSPLKFIPLAEETKIIIDLGAWILEEACSNFVQLQKEGFILEQISVNVSSIQLKDSDMVQTLRKVIEKTGIKAQQLELEITESYIATNQSRALQTLREIQAMEIGLAIDDFGTGYSSLSYLQKLPISRLKIDKSFVDHIPEKQEDVAIVKVILALAKTLGLLVTAEGVQTQEQLAFLEGQDCDEIQGYYYSKPLGIEALKKFIQEEKR